MRLITGRSVTSVMSKPLIGLGMIWILVEVSIPSATLFETLRYQPTNLDRSVSGPDEQKPRRAHQQTRGHGLGSYKRD